MSFSADSSPKVAAFLERIRQGRQGDEGKALPDYAQLRAQYDAQANHDLTLLRQQQQQRQVEHLMEAADLNPHWVFSEMDEHDPLLAEHIQTAKSFVGGFSHWEQHGGGCCFIYGDYGTGKSTLAGAIAHELILVQKKSVLFQQWSTIARQQLYSGQQAIESRERHRQLLESVDLLVIDELCAGRSTLPEIQATLLGHVLRRRRNVSKSVILITNHTPDTLHRAVGDFCFEAIKAFHPVDMPLFGPSRRPPLGHYQG